MNIKELSGVKWWIRKQKGNALLLTLIGVLFLLVFVYSLTNMEDIKSSGFFFTTLFGLFVAFFTYCGIREIIRPYNFNEGEYWFGTITNREMEVEYYRSRGETKDRKKYWIEADVDGQNMVGECYPETYFKAKIGDKILLFINSDQQIFAVHPEM